MIHGLSQRRRLPRLGKIRLGVTRQTSSGKEYPAELDHFVVPPEVATVYGGKPKQLDVILPNEDPRVVFDHALKLYASGGLVCRGDGKLATRRKREKVRDPKPGQPNERWSNEFEERACPCEFRTQGKCKPVGHLMVFLYRVSIAGCYQIDTSSENSIVDLLSAMEQIRALRGRISGTPLILSREPRQTRGGGQVSTHYTLQLRPPAFGAEWERVAGYALELHERLAQLRGDTSDARQGASFPATDGSGEAGTPAHEGVRVEEPRPPDGAVLVEHDLFEDHDEDPRYRAAREAQSPAGRERMDAARGAPTPQCPAGGLVPCDEDARRAAGSR